ncbi:hypothetical protein QJS04_geneDACA019489 [Acorus gramineus]|uniref:Activating signal cointegrator 1 n=1 Tax=Acorus gramineus TaxID=55184 RepID=A0AAV9AA48_ACOGR|nr:hypothetical protein QJS04_geneDACA019489 [Acorus gramineus]
MGSKEEGSSGEWLERALFDLCGKIETGLDLDGDLIRGLVPFCERAPPEDAAEYLKNIIGEEAGGRVIQEYMRRRGYVDLEKSNPAPSTQNSSFQAYMKPPAEEVLFSGSKKQTKLPKPKEGNMTTSLDTKNQAETSEPKDKHRGGQGASKKKKAGKVISLAEAAKGSIVFQQGKPCNCQARRHKLVSNCLSCGKIVCEQEGEGPCSFCGALVLKEGSTYAGLENMVAPPLSDAEAEAEAFAKRLVDYDRNSAARTTVIDDQSDYYDEGNSWLSKEEKELLKKKQQEIEEADKLRRSKVIVTFDLVGRKVLMNKDEASESETENRILRPLEERELNRIKPNPTVKIQPVFINVGPTRSQSRGKQTTKASTGICLEISGRVQHDNSEIRRLMASEDTTWRGPSITNISHSNEETFECSPDYN